MWYDFEVALYNIGDGQQHAKLEDIVNLADNEGVSVIFLQEAGDRQWVVNQFLKSHHSWRVVWRYKMNKSREVAILYDSAVWSKVWWHEIFVRIGFLGPQGAGGDAPAHKALNMVRLRHRKARQVVKFLNHHAIASAFSTRGAEGRRRKEAFARQMRAFFSNARKGLVIGGGDWNAGKSNRLVRLYQSSHWRWLRTGPTHRKNTIDMIGFLRNPNLQPTGAKTVETDGSLHHRDHKAVVGKFKIRKR